MTQSITDGDTLSLKQQIQAPNQVGPFKQDIYCFALCFEDVQVSLIDCGCLQVNIDVVENKEEEQSQKTGKGTVSQQKSEVTEKAQEPPLKKNEIPKKIEQFPDLKSKNSPRKDMPLQPQKQISERASESSGPRSPGKSLDPTLILQNQNTTSESKG